MAKSKHEADESNIYGILAEPILENLKQVKAATKYLRKQYPDQWPSIGSFILDPQGTFPIPTEKQINVVVAKALDELPGLLKEAGVDQPTKKELARLERTIASFLREAVTSDLDLKAAISGGRIGIQTNLIGNYFVANINGAVDTIIASRDGGFGSELAAFWIIVMDIILEVFGMLLNLMGFRPPKPDVDVLKKPMSKLVKDKGFKQAIKRLMDGLEAGDPTAIIIFIQYIRSVGVLGEILSAWLDSLDWFDYVAAFGKALAWFLLATATAGASLLAKIGHLILNALELYSKMNQLKRMWERPVPAPG